MGMLDGKIAIVTGAGQGLGRAEALELAREGAKVVVNDLGVTVDGVPTPEHPAQVVAEEIKAAGGEAVAHDGDVADWNAAKAMIGLAISTFGDLHVLVNNAGILRDRMIFNMSEEEWDAVVRVHLKGHFCPTRHATEYWREKSKKAGGPIEASIVNTSSEAWLMGSPGQPNYGAAKAGIVGLTNVVAQAMGRFGVRANAVCPRAATRMTEMFSFDKDEFAPENVAPLVAFLASPAAERVSGYLFIAWGGQVTVLDSIRTAERFETKGRWTPAGLADATSAFFEKREPVTDGFIHKG